VATVDASFTYATGAGQERMLVIYAKEMV
jgi:hypothetical protein